MRTVLAGDFEIDRILAGFHDFAGVILTVPLERVLAGAARGAGNRVHDVLTFRHGAHAVRAVPGFHFGEVAVFLIPKGDGPDLEAVGILHPRGDEWALGKATRLSDFKVDGEYHRRVPETAGRRGCEGRPRNGGLRHRRHFPGSPFAIRDALAILFHEQVSDARHRRREF